MKATTHQIKVSRKTIWKALYEVQQLLDQTQHWCAVRIDADGSVRVFEEVSRCESQDEYYHRMPHTVTVFSGTGCGQCNTNWKDGTNDDTQEVCEDLIDGCIEKLEAAGYEVEVTA